MNIEERSDRRGVAVDSYEAFNRRISTAYTDLSPALQSVARCLSQNPNEIGIYSLTALSEKFQIPASNFVRFAKVMGFSGFAELQRIYRSRIEGIIPSFEDRLARFSEETGADRDGTSTLATLIREDFRLLSEIDLPKAEETCQHFADTLVASRRIFVTGAMRFHSISCFLHYSFTYLGMNSTLLDNQGFYAPEYAQCFEPESCIVATSVNYYHREVISLVELAAKKNCPVLAITDFDFSPLNRLASHCILLPGLGDNFRVSPAAALIIAQQVVNETALRRNKCSERP